MDWLQNLILYFDTKSVGECPQCNGENIKVTEHKHEKRTSITFECKDCSAFAHFD